MPSCMAIAMTDTGKPGYEVEMAQEGLLFLKIPNHIGDTAADTPKARLFLLLPEVALARKEFRRLRRSHAVDLGFDDLLRRFASYVAD
jgi:hypothetical protein